MSDFIWRVRFALRVWQQCGGEVSWAFAWECANAAERDFFDSPVGAADEEMSYWDE